MIILEKPNTHCTDEHPYTLLRCVLGNHYKTVQWFYLACNIPTDVSPPVWASYPPRSPLLCLMGSSHHSCTHTTPRFNHRSFTDISVVLPSQLPCTTGWYAKTRLYHKLCQAVPILAHGCTIFIGGRSMNRFLDLGMITNHKLPASHRTKALNHQHRTDKFPIPSPQILFSMLVGSK
jgi:hypothetical protein